MLTIYETLTLIISFSMLVITIIVVSDKK